MPNQSQKSHLRRENQRQMGLIHGDMSADLQSALRHLHETMENVPEDEWKRREKRWKDALAYVESHQLAEHREARLN
jgi:hypothetical protein